MANAKIYGIAMTILDVMKAVFPQDYRDFVFAGLLDSGDVVAVSYTHLTLPTIRLV